MRQCLKFILFGVTLYMFRTVLPSIIRSLKTVHTATGICQRDTADCLLASSQQYLTYACCYMYSLETPDDGRQDRPKHVECYSN